MTKPEQELERLGRKLSSGPGVPGMSEQLAPETIWDAVTGKLPAKEVAEAAARAVADPRLATEWRLAAAVARQRDGNRSASVHRFPVRRSILLPFAMAALVVLAVGLPVLHHRIDSRQHGFRGMPEAPIERLPARPAAGGGLVLRWRCPLEEVHFDVVVSDGQLRYLTGARNLDQPEFRVSGDVLQQLEDGSTILWQVWAVTPEGGRIPSRTFVEHLPASR